MRKPALHRQRRGRQNHARKILEQRPVQDLGNINRRRLQIRITRGLPQRPGRPPLDPEHRVLVFRLQQKLQMIADIRRPLLQPRRFFHVAHPLQLSLQPMQRVTQPQVQIAARLQELIAPMERHARLPIPARRLRQCCKKHARPLPHQLRRADNAGRERLLVPQRRLQVAHQLFKPHIAQPDPEVAARNIFELVRLIEDHRVALRQNPHIWSRLRMLPDRQVREKQVVVHDDHIALQRLPSHLRDEAVVVVRARLPQARLGPRIQLVPQLAVLRQPVNLRPVASRRRLFPRGNLLELVNLFQPIQDRRIRQRIQLVPAQIVGPALHVADPQRPQQRLQERHILEKQLLLQVLRARRNNHPLPAAQCRQQVGQRLTGPRPRLHNQVLALGQRTFHRLRHLQLSLTELIRQRRLRQHPTRRKKLVQRRQLHRRRSRGQNNGRRWLRAGRHGGACVHAGRLKIRRAGGLSL